MNIQQFWPKDEELPPPTELGWAEIIQLRVEIFAGFAEIERHKGIVDYPMSLGTPRGQEAARSLLFRVIEEMMESVDSDSADHRKEEAIDAFNYMLSVLIMDPKLFKPGELIDLVMMAEAAHPLTYAQIYQNIHSGLDQASIMLCVKAICGDLADTFRNRAWMNEAQNLYFEGRQELIKAARTVFSVLLSLFDNWNDFCRFYVAKARVLQFRLRSSY